MFSRCGLGHHSAYFILFLTILAVATPGSLAAERSGSDAREEALQRVVSTLKARLGITVPVVVSIVPTNALMMSVEAPKEEGRPFQLSIEASFLETLTDDEVEAAIAHELGHVWVFTHHPYLQTEELANQIAMRAVRRETLERVYAKVWQRGGTKGDLARFLGAPPTAQPAAAGLATDTSR